MASVNDNLTVTDNFISDNPNNTITDIQVIRKINGGTKIITEFDNTCPEEMKAPFEYACKIMEEYLPPCYPIKIQVTCKSRPSSRSAISTVSSRYVEDKGQTSFRKVLFTMIKGVHMAEVAYGSPITFIRELESIGNDVFTLHDMIITYNLNKFNDISFSIDLPETDKIDFVSLALRDILTGIGFQHSYEYKPADNLISKRSEKSTPFEAAIENSLLNYQNSHGCSLIQAATCGELPIGNFYSGQTKLYAPDPWDNAASLKYYIPTAGFDFTNILAYNFGKGTVSRSLNDNKSEHLFYSLLGWQPSIEVGSHSTSYGSSGSTSILVPYNGSISLDYKELSVSGHCSDYQEAPALKNKTNSVEEIGLALYLDQFCPFLTGGSSAYNGISYCVLKKDGTWDVVYFKSISNPMDTDIKLNMNDWTFHCDNDEYARTVDGYLRARVTTKSPDGHGGNTYYSTFFVIDYLPQITKLSYRKVPDEETSSLVSPLATPTAMKARIFFADTEGVDRITLEILRQGSRIPTKANITDFKKGYHDISISRTSTVTAVAYNKNGSVRSLPLTVVYQSPDATQFPKLSMSVENGMMEFIDNDNRPAEVEFSIIPISSLNTNPVISGVSYEPISIDSLEPGMYVVKASDPKTGATSTFKLKK